MKYGAINNILFIMSYFCLGVRLNYVYLFLFLVFLLE